MITTVIILAIISLVWIMFVARIWVKAKNNVDPMTAIVPKIVISTVNKLPKVLERVEKEKQREKFRELA